MPVLGYKTKIFIDEIPLALKVSGFSYQSSVNPLPFTTLQVGAVQKIAGLSDQMMTVNGYLIDNSASDLRAMIQDALDSEEGDSTITWMLSTDIDTPVGGSFSSTFASELNIETPLDNLLTVGGKFERISTSIHGKFASNEEVVDATGALTYYIDFGAAGSAGGDVLIIISDITGTATDATIIIESDDNTGFSSAATEATLQFSAEGVVTGTMSGTVDRYVRARCSDLGGATDFTLTILVGLDGVTQ